jgi:glycosyltransferase involved in cell wall biosynthesis
MKILHIIDSGGLYGAEIMLLNLMTEQIRLGHDPILASIGDLNCPEKEIESESIKKGITVQKFRMRPGPNFLGAIHILDYAMSQNINLLHSHGYKSNILFGFMPKWFRKLPLVTTIHGWTGTSGFNKMKIYEWFDSISLRFIDVIVLVNSAMKNHKKIVGRKNLNIQVINNGIVLREQVIDKEKKIELDSEIIKFCRSGFTVGAIGRLSVEKGYDCLLDAIKTIKDTIDDVRLIIIGEGSQRHELEHKINALDLRKNIFLPGYIRNAKEYIPFFDLFVLSSLTEGLPMTVLEAMDAGVPIVATKVGGVPDVLGHGKFGHLVNKATGAELAQGIMQIIREPEKGKTMAEKAKLQVSRHFTSALMAKQYVEIYRSLF